MSIKVGQAFERTSANPIDESIALTKAKMLTVNDNLMPAYYFTICQDDGKLYLYDKTATPDPTTGKFKKFEGDSGAGGHEIVDTDGSSLPAEDKLQFIGLDVTDNSTDGETEVESFGLNADSLDDVVSGNISASIVQPFMNYSTNETVVGKWIDGKPIYQKTIISTLPDAVTIGTVVWKQISIGSPIDMVVNFSGTFNPNGLYHTLPLDVDVNSGWQYAAKAVISDNSYSGGIFAANTLILGNADIAWNSAPAQITIQYTKAS